MAEQENFFHILKEKGICFFTGVPDSYLNGFCNYLKKNMPLEQNIITANEGNAVALAAGYYFASGEIPLVYMQNSGLCNAINPLLSLADKNVYSVPMLLLIGWRGKPGTKDGEREQHMKQGEVTLPLLEDMSIPYHILSAETYEEDVVWAVSCARENASPVALVVPDGILTENKENTPDDSYPMSREEAIQTVLELLPQDTVYIATTGRATRELFAQRELHGEGHERDFLNIGSMGHASSVAIGIALKVKTRRVVCFDGDAAAIMHMGAMATVSKLDLPNFLHIVLNNGAHESVGGQPSAGYSIDLTSIAEGCGYYTVGHPVTNRIELEEALQMCIASKTASFIDMRIHCGIRSDLQAIGMDSHELIDGLKKELKKEGL